LCLIIYFDTFQGEEEEEQEEAEVTSTPFNNHYSRKPRITVRKYPFSHPFARLDPNYSLKTTQHAALRQSDCGGSSAGVSGSDVNKSDSHKRPREVLLHPTPLLPKAGLFRHPLNPSDSDYQVSSSSDDTSESPDMDFVIKPG
jgi:hypothetical protein